jgi:hypothetical protein
MIFLQRLGFLFQREGLAFLQLSDLRHLFGDIRIETISRGHLTSWLHPFSSSAALPSPSLSISHL